MKLQPLQLLEIPHAVDEIQRGDAVDGLLGGGFVQVQHGVGERAPGPVHHVVDVDALGGHLGGDGAQRVGHVGVQHGQAVLEGRAQRADRIVDGVDDGAELQIVLQLMAHHVHAVVLALG